MMYTGFACKETGYWLGIFTISLVVSPLPGHAWAKVKFVPHSTCLTEVLRQSRGNVMAWLSQHKPKSMTVESATWFQMVFRFIISTSFRSFARTWSLCRLCRKMPPKKPSLPINQKLSAIVSLFDDQRCTTVWIFAPFRATQVMDNLCGSVAASCVVTYVLGIGDRHLENICLTPSGWGCSWAVGHGVARKKVRKEPQGATLMSASLS